MTSHVLLSCVELSLLFIVASLCQSGQESIIINTEARHWTDSDASTFEGNEATTTNSSDSKHTLDIGGVPIVSHLTYVLLYFSYNLSIHGGLLSSLITYILSTYFICHLCLLMENIYECTPLHK